MPRPAFLFRRGKTFANRRQLAILMQRELQDAIGAQHPNIGKAAGRIDNHRMRGMAGFNLIDERRDDLPGRTQAIHMHHAAIVRGCQ